MSTSSGVEELLRDVKSNDALTRYLRRRRLRVVLMIGVVAILIAVGESCIKSQSTILSRMQRGTTPGKYLETPFYSSTVNYIAPSLILGRSVVVSTLQLADKARGCVRFVFDGLEMMWFAPEL